MTFDDLLPSPEFSVVPATPWDISLLLRRAASYMTLAASEEVVRKAQIRCLSMLSIWRNGALCGGFAMLPLNERGHAALLDGSLSRSDPSWDHLAPRAAKFSAIYVWAILCPGAAAGNIMQEFLRRPEYCDAPFYSHPLTPGGLSFMRRGGGQPLTGHPSLWIYRRARQVGR